MWAPFTKVPAYPLHAYAKVAKSPLESSKAVDAESETPRLGRAATTGLSWLRVRLMR